MDFDELIRKRYSCRQFSPEPPDETELDALLQAANAAPVGSARYMDLHLTVVRDRTVLDRLAEAMTVRIREKQKEMAAIVETVKGQDPKRMPGDPFYGAPAVIFVSHKKQDLQPGIEWCNAMNLAMFIQLKATEMGLASCFSWGVLESERMFPDYDHNELLQLPADFEPLIGIMVGHAEQPAPERGSAGARIGINYLT